MIRLPGEASEGQTATPTIASGVFSKFPKKPTSERGAAKHTSNALLCLNMLQTMQPLRI